jgi:hypothetical protein
MTCLRRKIRWTSADHDRAGSMAALQQSLGVTPWGPTVASTLGVAEDGAPPKRERGVAPGGNSPGRTAVAAGAATSEILQENYRITIVRTAWRELAMFHHSVNRITIAPIAHFYFSILMYLTLDSDWVIVIVPPFCKPDYYCSLLFFPPCTWFNFLPLFRKPDYHCFLLLFLLRTWFNIFSFFFLFCPVP